MIHKKIVTLTLLASLITATHSPLQAGSAPKKQPFRTSKTLNKRLAKISLDTFLGTAIGAATGATASAAIKNSCHSLISFFNTITGSHISYRRNPGTYYLMTIPLSVIILFSLDKARDRIVKQVNKELYDENNGENSLIGAVSIMADWGAFYYFLNR